MRIAKMMHMGDSLIVCMAAWWTRGQHCSCPDAVYQAGEDEDEEEGEEGDSNGA